jgi:SAM-dependent methyltransferase
VSRPAPRFADFDRRGYRTVDVRRGYGEWVATYETTVQDAMDVELLDAITSVRWDAVREAADLGCGTGRTGAWLRSVGVATVDGVDLTPEMLEVARARGVYRRLVEGDVSTSGLPGASYDAVTMCLVDEHLTELGPAYSEAFRIVRPGGSFVLVGYHPHFIMAAGMPTHYDSASGEPVAIETYLHPISAHVEAGVRAGLLLVEMKERFIDDAWVALKPKWERFRGYPISMALVWRRTAS